MSARVLKISSTGKCEFCDVELDKDGGIPLETIQRAVGGFIEHVDVPVGSGSLDMWVNETGTLDGLGVNEVATRLSGIWKWCDWIVGDVIVCAHTEFGESVGISEEDEDALRKELAA